MNNKSEEMFTEWISEWLLINIFFSERIQNCQVTRMNQLTKWLYLLPEIQGLFILCIYLLQKKGLALFFFFTNIADRIAN